MLLAAASAFSSYNPAYGTAYSASSELDQAAFTSAAFWAEVARELPGFADDPELERFRGFARNLRTEPPGAQRVRANGQVLLRIDGRFEGELVSEGDLIIGPGGVLVGDIEGMGQVIIDGKVIGNMEVKKLDLRDKAAVHGNITCE